MRKLILFLSLILSVGFTSARSEIPFDSIRRAPSSNIKEFGGSLLDMGLMNVAPPKLPKFSLGVPDVSKDYNQMFRLNTGANCTQGLTNAFFSPLSSFGYGYGWGLSSSPQSIQMDTFRLKNEWKTGTYRDYNRDGQKVPNRSAIPQEENSFREAFELKSPNGNFGIRIEVQQEQNSLYQLCYSL